MEYYFDRKPDGSVVISKQSAPLDNEHHRKIVERFYSSNKAVGLPTQIRQYYGWNDVVDEPDLTEETLVFVDGGVTERPINLGRAVLVNDGGIIKHPITCGWFYKDGGLIIESKLITELLREKPGSETNNT